MKLPFALAFLVPTCAAFADDKPSVTASVESTLATGGQNIRQLALDGDPATFFASDKNAAKDDTFTVVFDAPVVATDIAILGGKPDKSDPLQNVSLEVSEDGKTFEQVAGFSGIGLNSSLEPGRSVKALRLKVNEPTDHPLVIREITVKSFPEVVTFKWPVEFVVDVTDAPELKEWAESTAKACILAYPMICEELKSEGYTPARLISMTMKSSYKGVAMAGGTRITGSVKYFKDRPNDVGAMVHETTHVVQRYRGRGNPSWLVEGLADYVRFFKYEPGKIGKIDAEKAKYDASYRTSAAFLAYVVDKYSKTLINDLNKAMREGKYNEEIFKEKTGKPLKELGEEWKETLKK